MGRPQRCVSVSKNLRSGLSSEQRRDLPDETVFTMALRLTQAISQGRALQQSQTWNQGQTLCQGQILPLEHVLPVSQALHPVSLSDLSQWACHKTEAISSCRPLQNADHSVLSVHSIPGTTQGTTSDVTSITDVKTDAVAVSLSMGLARKHDVAGLQKLDREVLGRKPPGEPRLLTLRTGKRLVEGAVAMDAGDFMEQWYDFIRLAESPGTYPVSLGLLCVVLGLEAAQGLCVYQSGIIMPMLSNVLQLMRRKCLDTQGAKRSLRLQCKALCRP